jgi:hypothetical protein
VKSLTSGLLASCRALFGILATCKCDSSTVMRDSSQRYLAFVAFFLVILMAWKYVFSISWDTRLKVPCLPVVAYSTFCWPENEILETISPRVHEFLSKHILCVFAEWKCDSARVMSIWPTIVPPGIWNCS